MLLPFTAYTPLPSSNALLRSQESIPSIVERAAAIATMELDQVLRARDGLARSGKGDTADTSEAAEVFDDTYVKFAHALAAIPGETRGRVICRRFYRANGANGAEEGEPFPPAEAVTDSA